MSLAPLPLLVLVVALGYLVGSIPFGLLLTRMAGLGDIRQIGSGNIGATNVLRTGHRGLAAATLLLDAAKGAVAVASTPAPMAPAAACAVVLGHIFPLWLGFRGGKGVATAAGALVVLCPLVGAIAVAAWLLLASVTRTSSLGALGAAAAAAVTALVVADPPHLLAVLVIVAAVVWRHQTNIRRLIAGEETRIRLGR